MRLSPTPFPPLNAQAAIRLAKPSDKLFVAGLSEEVFSIYGPYRTAVIQWFESDATMTFVYVVEERPIGFVMVGALLEGRHGMRHPEVLAIAVSPGFQKRGIGEKLLQFAQRCVAQNGESRLFVHTAKENTAAQKLFLKNGYRPVMRKESFYPSGQDAIMMVSELRMHRNYEALE